MFYLQTCIVFATHKNNPLAWELKSDVSLLCGDWPEMRDNVKNIVEMGYTYTNKIFCKFQSFR